MLKCSRTAVCELSNGVYKSKNQVQEMVLKQVKISEKYLKLSPHAASKFTNTP